MGHHLTQIVNTCKVSKNIGQKKDPMFNPFAKLSLINPFMPSKTGDLIRARTIKAMSLYLVKVGLKVANVKVKNTQLNAGRIK